MPNKSRSSTRGARSKSRGNARKQGYLKLNYLPSRQTVTMAYSGAGWITEGSLAAGATFSLALNSLYDPVVAVGGNQPIPFDQWAAMFNRFRVIHCKITVEFTSLTLPAGASQVGFSLCAVNALPTDTRAWAVQPYTKTRMMSMNNAINGYRRLSYSVVPWDVLGLTRQQYMDDMDYSHSAAGNPSRMLYAILWAVGINGPAASVVYTFFLDYTVEVSERNPLSHS